MGYFANGTEGMEYEDRYCCRCINYRSTEEINQRGCPVLDLHSLWNYEACSDPIKKSALDSLIPRDERGFNKQCRMFIPEDSDIKWEICGKCGNAAPQIVEKIEGNMCVNCAGNLEKNLLKSS